MGFGGWNAKRGRVRTVVTGLGSVGLASIVVVLGLVTGAAAEPCDVAADLEYVALGDWRLFFYNRDRLAKLTTKEIEQAAAHFRRDEIPPRRQIGHSRS